MKYLNVTHFERQSVAGECGLAAIAMVARFHGYCGSLSEFRRRFPSSIRGMNAKTLISIADNLRLNVRPIKCTIDSLNKISLPAILHWDLNHYVVLSKVSNSFGSIKYIVADPAKDLIRIDQEEISKHYTGIAFELWPTKDFSEKKEEPKLKIHQLWTRINGIFPGLLKIFGLSVLLQIITMLAPIQMQQTIDAVLPTRAEDLALILLCGFFVLLIINTSASLIRGLLIVNLSSSLSYQTSVNLLRHILFLPSRYFGGRHLGDVVSRFNSLQPVSDLLSKGIVSAAVDAILSLCTLVLMLIYSPLLASISIASLLLLIFSKYLTFKSARFINANLLANQASENTTFIENIRGIEAIKSFCQEENRVRSWQKKRAETINSTIKLGKFSLIFENLELFIVGFEAVLFVYLCGMMALAGNLTVGGIFSLQLYRQSFSGAASRFLSQFVNFKLMDVHLARLADIVRTKSEDFSGSEEFSAIDVIYSLELRGIYFQYSSDDPYILKGVNLLVASGETIAIVGPSGVGKTTLLRVVIGLLEPKAGEILVNGRSFVRSDLRAYRSLLGIVSQDDTLFAGSIIDNISFFESDPDVDKIKNCCKAACIDTDIELMPMKYDSLVGDMGSSLSGGQRQRLILARALYKNPSMLVVDEGTAHLDIETESRVTENIKKLGIPRLIVAHRPETILSANAVYLLNNGVLQDITKLASSIYGKI